MEVADMAGYLAFLALTAGRLRARVPGIPLRDVQSL